MRGAPLPSRFCRFAAIDWSGAKGSAHRGIAIAECSAGTKAPELVAPPRRHWSRLDVLDWIYAQDDAVLIGMDFSFAPPFIARGAYLPGEALPENARAFWAHVDALCDDPDLGAASFVEKHYRRHFYLGAADGRKADFMHFRHCEAVYNAKGGGKPSTIFDAIGAAQVSKASFAGMRLLNRVAVHVPVWPFMPLTPQGPALVEIYTSLAARGAGRSKGRSKIRSADALDHALKTLGSAVHNPLYAYDDHATDAIVTSAWLRAHAETSELWSPSSLTRKIATTEGWTFGVI